MAESTEETRILIAHLDTGLFAEIDEALVDERVMRIVARTTNADQTISVTSEVKPDVIVIDGDALELDAIHTLEKIFVQDLPVGSIILWAAQDNDSIRAAMRVGAEDFLIKPVDPETLLTAVDEVFKVVREKFPDGWAAPPPSPADAGATQDATAAPGAGKATGICSGKAGVGKTTLATNLAIALAKYEGSKTTLVDLDHSDAAVLLNIRPARSLKDLAQIADELDVGMVNSCMAHHKEGLNLLPGSTDPGAEDLDVIPFALLERVVNILRQTQDHIVILLPMLHGDEQLRYIELCDMVYLVATDHNLLDLKGTKTFLDTITRKHVGEDRTHVVLNQHSKDGFVSSEDMEKTFGRKIRWVLPDDQKLVTDSINMGVPFVLKEPKNPLSAMVIQLAAFTGGNEDALPAEADGKHGWWPFGKKH